MSHRHRGFVFPIILIVVGVIFLLANTGILTEGALQRLGDLWPLLLVLLGLQLVLNHTLPRPQASLVGLVAAGVAVIAALAYAELGPPMPTSTQQLDFAEPVGGLTAATLDLNSGVATDVRSGTLGDQLYQAHVDDASGAPAPNVSLDRDSGTLEIRSSDGFVPFRFFNRTRRRHLALTLSDRLPWAVQLSLGAAAVHLHLAHLQLSRLEISGGADRLDAELPKPRGTLRVDVAGGVRTLTLRAPAGTEWTVNVSGSVSAMEINGTRVNGIGDLHQQSHGYASATNRLDIEVSGGASHVDFRTG